MKVAVPKERAPGELRVAAVPRTVKQLVAAGLEVHVEKGAGAGCFIDDEAYVKAGAQLADDPQSLYKDAALVLKVTCPCAFEDGPDEIALLPEGAILVSTVRPFSNLATVSRLAEGKVSCLAMDLVPRTTRAQFMDSLSSMATITGYKAVLLAAHHLPKIFPMLNTAAGTLAPAKVFILGAGVAGLQAIATARRLGAMVEAFDVRPAVKEQVESLGARFVELIKSDANLEDKSGYAKEQTEEQKKQQEIAMQKHIAKSDVVITTALIQGRKAPILIKKEAVEAMQPGSVIIDLAAELGGNCELTEPGKTVVKHGVTLVGDLNLPSTLSVHSSQLYARNVANLVKEMLKDGKLDLDLGNDILSGCLLTHEGAVKHEPTRNALAKEAA